MNKVDWKNKNIWFGVVALVFIISISFYFKGSENKEPENILEGEIKEESTLPTGENAEEKAVTKTTTKKKTAPAESRLTYAEALEKYKDFRIQFDSNCQARPNNVTYKDGTSIMLDNRAGVDRKIVVGSTYLVPAYGFKIVKLDTKIIPTTWLVDCGSQQNVATILIQD